jgi:hypothetical protein
MTTDIDEIIDDRLGRWREFLRSRRAVPVLTLGLKPSPKKWDLVLTAPGEVTDAQVVEILEAALAQARARRTERP